MVNAEKKGVRVVQLELFRHGGKRAGAGRKPKGEQALCPRDARIGLASRFPVLVTVRVRTGLPSLRGTACTHVVFESLELASPGSGFRIVHGSVQTNHLHLILEACDADALARGMCGLLTRIARGLNRAWRRRGTVFTDRYHAHVLRSPLEVRRALVYVLHNAKKHGSLVRGVDPLSSGPWFDGWRESLDEKRTLAPRGQESPFAPARTWLLSIGWRRHGLIGLDESPLSAAHRARERARQPSSK